MQAEIGFGEGDMEKSVAGIKFGEGVVGKSVTGIAFRELDLQKRVFRRRVVNTRRRCIVNLQRKSPQQVRGGGQRQRLSGHRDRSKTFGKPKVKKF